MTKAFPKHAWWYWLAATLIYFVPGWHWGMDFLLGSKDSLFYTMVLKLYGSALAGGELYPRWFAEANAGQGSPVMVFYSPLSYLLTSLLFGWMPDDPFAHKRFLAGIVTAQVAGGCMAFLWLKPRFGEKFALLGSLLYLLFPYKLLNLWMHHNLAQFWVMAWLPLWMLAADKMAEGRPRAVAYYGICLALVAYTHLLTLIAFIALPACYVLFVSKEHWIQHLGKLAVAHVIGFGVCALYFLPIILNRPFVWSSSFLDDFYNVFWHLKSYDTYFVLYYLVIAGLAAGLVSRLPAKSKDSDRRPFWFFVWASFILWLMTTPVSWPVWKFVPLLEYLQFPVVRLHPAMLICGVWIAVYGLRLWRQSRQKAPVWVARFYSPFTALSAVIVCGLIMYHMAQLQYFCYTARIYHGEALKEVHRVNGIPPLEYLTIWHSPDSLMASLLDGTEKKPLATVIKGLGEARAIRQSNRRFALEADIHSETATIGFRQWYFPGWEASDGNTANPVDLNEDTGNMMLTLPHGRYKLEVSLSWLLGEKAGMALSLLTILGIGTYFRLSKSSLRGALSATKQSRNSN